ncbi:hypothetical protein HDF24_19980 [Mucilaginibacter sp. X4EP1]|uniref:hypothetical protein n=1 Tax=Mucilaginibacter sp. X4EP1 TaxID=2723092 RepID=UPI0021695935|nr:hypothetical protein [Mucilaginibacter sp. X4EP1]MCS3812752.1 hypothetical protein [Mucilaginibacter sp. X4EP1]
MPQFISKLQHKYYEKGEYADEKVRTLQDTLQLIKDFPWDRERGVDVQLTGPSVVIQDENTNYLKVALYFNGKYCLYYFDCDHHLYEFHTSELNDIYELVTKFFDGQINLQKFEKHTLSIGVHKHFESIAFDYTVSSSKFYFQLFFITLAFLAPLILTSRILFTRKISEVYPILVFVVCFSLFFLYLLVLMLKKYSKFKNMYLNISCGNDVFKFGDGETITEYNKADIAKINIYGKPGSNSMLTIIEINFNDGTRLEFPTFLIDSITFIAKFHDQTKYEYVINRSQINSKMWNY